MAARNFGLDLLRAVSIVLVLGNHAFLGFVTWYGHMAWDGAAAAVSTATFLSIEWLFVLSGFLIGTMMIRSFETGSTWWQRAREFWLRRWFRTMPLYYLFLVVNVLATAMGIGMGTYSVSFALFSQNLAWKEAQPLFYNESWSLALDEWFYLLMPILVGVASWLLRLKPRVAFLAVAVTLIAAPAVARFFHAVPVDLFDWNDAIRRVTLYHLDATGWGVLGAVTSRWWPGFWSRSVRGKAWLGLLLIVAGTYLIEAMYFRTPVPPLPRLNNLLTLTLPAAGTFLALPWVASLRPQGGAFGWAVDRISLYSYSIYLTHIPVMFVMRAALLPQEAASLPALSVQILFWLLFTLGLSALVHHSFEKPVSDLRERFTRKVDARPFEASPAPSDR